MRPAQIAREIGVQRHRRRHVHISFNEARANCAGNFAIQALVDVAAKASMRPAQIAREISTARRWPEVYRLQLQ